MAKLQANGKIIHRGCIVGEWYGIKGNYNADVFKVHYDCFSMSEMRHWHKFLFYESKKILTSAINDYLKRNN